VDAPVDVRVTGLPPRSTITLVATARDGQGVGWRSRLAFVASTKGVVDTHSAMKLFWSMHRTKDPTAATAFALAPGDMTVLVRAQARGHTVASGVLVRRAAAADVTATDTTLADEGFVGTYYAPPPGPPRPAVVQLGGSLGGHGALPAALLASHGYPTLSLAYFGEPGLPSELRRIPLEYFQAALRWLAARPGVDPGRLVVYGVSRGGEAALLVGATFPDLVHGVVSCTGSAYVLGSTPPGAAAWTYGGTPIAERGAIPVERIAGPVLAFFGGKDGIGDPTPSEQEIASRARRSGRKDIVVKVYPDAGHGTGCRIPNAPTGDEYPLAPGTTLYGGGTPTSNAEAAAAAWPLVLRFLRDLRA
jgi:dienelactone hydrolase